MKRCLALIISFVFTISVFSQESHIEFDSTMANQWVDSVMLTLSPKEKIGQLFILRANYPGKEFNRKRLEHYHKNKNSEKSKESRRRNSKKRYEKMLKNPKLMLKRRIGISIYHKLKNRGTGKKGRSSFCNILPYTVEELFSHLESLFEIGINWNSHGQGD